MDSNKFRNRQLLCHYCRKHNHRQEECRIRKQENQPCTDVQGLKYLPKVLFWNNGQEKLATISALRSLNQTPLVIL